MESETNPICPVCTLFLRPGITLKAHLASHPKQMVIEALIRLSSHEEEKQVATSTEANATVQPIPTQGWSPTNIHHPTLPTNHSFIYQQFMSSSTPQQNILNVNPMGQQYVQYPTATVFNPQMMCPTPYVYHQQQQVIMSSGHPQMPALSRILPIEPPTTTHSQHVANKETTELIDEDIDNEIQEPDLVIIETNDGETNILSVPPNEDMDILEDEEDASECALTVENQDDLTDNAIKIDQTEEHVIQGNTIISLDEPLDIILKTQNYEANDDKNYDDSETKYDDEDDNNYDDDPSFEQDFASTCNANSSYLMDRDLNKSCQTNSTDRIKDNEVNEDQKQFYFSDQTDNEIATQITAPDHSSYVTLTNTNMNGNGAVNSPNPSVDAPNAVAVMDMDGMNLMLSNEFMNNQIIAQVEDFDYNSRCERPRILMNIGEYTETREIGDESISVDSANIRADEHMPPRGELSGQESNASDIAWSRLQYHESSSGMSSSYDLLARETWEASDGSDNEELPPLQSRVPPTYDDTPTVSGYTDPRIQYKCPTCDENFNCPKERRVHQAENHGKPSAGIASKLGKKKVKKLVIKPKKDVIKTETNFDNVFTNKLKMEVGEVEVERASVILESSSQIIEVKKDDVISNPVVCTICEAVLADNATLKQHQLDIHNFNTLGDRYKCSTCDESFPCEPKYTEHLAIHPLECRLCGKYFYRRQNMQLHMKRHLGIKPYKCNICEKAFLTKQKLDEHRNVHTGDAPIKCNLCDEVFRRHSNLVQHRNRHHFNIKKKVKDYICHCGEIFHSKKKIAWHKEVHENKPKACTQCSEKFIHVSSLTRHMRRAHNERYVPNDDRATENVECPICKGVYLRSSLEVHIRSHSGNRPYTCLICNKDFTTKWNLKLHKWTHASRTQKPFKCDQCKGAFIRESDYTAHMNSHKSIKPYTCNYCGAQFIRKYNCQRHVREHEKVKNFTCNICGKCFHRSYYLKDHMRVHSGLRPFACHICGKTSTTKSNHNKHVRIHHAREPVSTEN